MRRQRISALLIVVIVTLIIVVTATADTGHRRQITFPRRTAYAKLLGSLQLLDSDNSDIAELPAGAGDSVQLFVELPEPTLAQVWLDTAGQNQQMSTVAMQRHAADLAVSQASVSAAVTAMDGDVLANYSNVFNGLAVEINAARISELYNIPGVSSINAVVDYQLALNDTVPWIGAAAVQVGGYDGTGIRVALVDTGIDYTHAHLGGSGSQADTDRAIIEASSTADPSFYPSSKVIGGYDFIGSNWDGSSAIILQPDPNPMDDNGGDPGGHGTHVASIIAGIDTSGGGGIGPGVAPGASLYALKVCSSISTSCSGVAMRQAFDWVADPNGDKDFSDRADVMNLSLGSKYGQTGDHDLAIMDQLSALGTITVAAAGNDGNHPYVLNSPANAASVISVAQTTLPPPSTSGIVSLSFVPGLDAALTDAIVSSSSRGPSFDTNSIKPEIGAPGGSMSASSGNQGYARIGGTSSSTPMVAGSVALLLEANGGSGALNWSEVKALLMNNASTQVAEGIQGSDLAPISRQGAGRLDVETAVNAEVLAYEANDKQAGLSFGLAPISGSYNAVKNVLVKNMSATTKQFNISAEFRFDEDKAYGITVTPSTNSVTVPAGGTVNFDVMLEAAGPESLPPYFELLGGGRNLINGDNLTTAEVDGFVTLENGTELINLPFHFLPRRAAALSADKTAIDVPVGPEVATVEIKNTSSIAGLAEAYQLFDISPRINTRSAVDEQPVDLQYVGSDVVIDAHDGDPNFDDHNVYLFAISTYETRSLPINVRHLVYVDLDRDGQDDWLVFNYRRGDGVWWSAQIDLHSNDLELYFTLDTALNSNNMVLYMLLPDTADPDLIYDFRVESYEAFTGGLIRKWDESPLGGGYHRHNVTYPKFVTDIYVAQIEAQGSISPLFQTKLTDSTQIGYMYRFIDGEQETTAVRMDVAGYRHSLLPFVAAKD